MTTNVIKKVSKSGKVSYQYFVDGALIRTSSRLYVASTVCGSFFWGRLDLVGKGDYIRACENANYCETVSFETLKNKAIKSLRHYEEVFEDYHNLNGNHMSELIHMYGLWGNRNNEEIKELADKRFAEDLKLSEEWLEHEKSISTDEYINEKIKRLRDEAVRLRASLHIVYYNISNL